jgi:hypothetical protein
LNEYLDLISEKFIDGEIDESTFLEYYLTTLKIEDSENDTEYYTENSNTEYKTIFKNAKKIYIKNVNEMKKLIREADKNDYQVFNDYKEEARESISSAMRKIKDIPSDTSSTIISLISKIITDLLKWSIPICASFGFSKIITHADAEINYYSQLLILFRKYASTDAQEWKDALNGIKHRYLKTLQVYTDTLDSLENVYINTVKDKQKSTKKKRSK